MSDVFACDPCECAGANHACRRCYPRSVFDRRTDDKLHRLWEQNVDPHEMPVRSLEDEVYERWREKQRG